MFSHVKSNMMYFIRVPEDLCYAKLVDFPADKLKGVNMLQQFSIAQILYIWSTPSLTNLLKKYMHFSSPLSPRMYFLCLNPFNTDFLIVIFSPEH